MGISFHEASVSEYFHEARELMQANAKETGYEGLEPEFHPQLNVYKQMEANNTLRCFIAKHDNKLIGYCLMITANHHHYGGAPWATQDVLYVDPEYRGFTSIKFIKWMDELLLKQKDVVISRSVSARRDYSKVLVKLGYGELEKTYVRGQ